MRFDIITIFSEAFESYLNVSMMKRAQVARPIRIGRHPGLKGLGAKKLGEIRIHDLRKFARDKHRKVDDKPYGGGPGMVLKIESIIKAIESIFKTNSKFETRNSKQIRNSKKLKLKTKIILFAAGGKQFDAKMAADFAKKYDRIIMIAGHYEGIDERIKSVIRDSKFIIQEVSIGPYVLTGGELPAMVVMDAVLRHVPGFLGKAESLEEKRYGVGVPTYRSEERR